MKRIVLGIVVMLLPMILHGQAIGAYISPSLGVWEPWNSAASFGALGSTPPAAYLYCQASLGGPWTPCNPGGGAPGVTQITAGTNITITPSGGTGNVTVNATSSGTIGGTISSPSVPYASGADTLSNSAFSYDATGAACDSAQSCLYVTQSGNTLSLTSGQIGITDSSGDTLDAGANAVSNTDSSGNYCALVTSETTCNSGTDPSYATMDHTGLTTGGSVSGSTAIGVSTTGALVLAQPTPPSVSSNAGTGSLTHGTDFDGIIAVGTASTATTLTFNQGWATWASCQVSASTSTALPYVSAISPASVTFTYVTTGTPTLYYHCAGQ